MSLTAEIREANTYADQHNAAWKAEARETAARIANDLQGAMAQAEELALAWAKDGLLDTTERRRVWDEEAREWRMVRANLSPLTVASKLATLIRENLIDQLSPAALAAMDEVAQ
jgi:hypothetical protein